MIWIAIVLAISAVVCVSCCVLAGDADRREEEMLRKEQGEDEEIVRKMMETV